VWEKKEKALDIWGKKKKGETETQQGKVIIEILVKNPPPPPPPHSVCETFISVLPL